MAFSNDLSGQSLHMLFWVSAKYKIKLLYMTAGSL